MLQKFTSRKFWAGLISTVLMYIFVGPLGMSPEVALAVISPLIAWIFGESYVDAHR